MALSQPGDSITTLNPQQTKKLRQFINEYWFLDSAYRSALVEIEKSDSAISVGKAVISDLEKRNFTLEESNSYLQRQVDILENSGLKWWHYGAGGLLVAGIGFLLGVLAVR